MHEDFVIEKFINVGEYFGYMSFFCNFAGVFVHAGEYVFRCGGCGHIIKRRLKRFVLANWNLANSKLTTKTMQHKMPIGVFQYTRLRVS